MSQVFQLLVRVKGGVARRRASTASPAAMGSAGGIAVAAPSLSARSIVSAQQTS